MFKIISKGFAEEVKTYGLFVSLLIIVAILAWVVSLVLMIIFPDKCELKILFASVGTFLISSGLIKRAQQASETAGKKR
jgi:hypothetical protein